MSQPSATPRFSAGALLSLVLGLLVLTGPLALLAGLRSLRAINASDGRLRGRAVAIAGMALGLLGSFFLLFSCLAVALVHLHQKSRLAYCSDNLRRIGLAVNLYQEKNDKQFPPGTVGNRDLPPPQRFSWLAAVLPYMDPGTPAGDRWVRLHGQLDFRQPWDASVNDPVVRQTFPRFLCPAHPPYDAQQYPGRTYYVGLAGLNPDAPLLPRDGPRAGFFGYDRTIARDDVVRGTSYTMMATETEQDNGRWAEGGPATVRGLDPDCTDYAGNGRPFGGLHHGLLNVLWVDGSVRPVPDTIAPPVFRAQATLGE
jgi:prepilin-type processing-associated H-X9-DG protein